MVSRFRKNLLALVLGLGPIVALEAFLAVVGVRPLADEDPFVGFEGSRPMLVPEAEDPGLLRLNPAKAEYFNPQSVRVPKPAGTFRIVAFGGSTTYGHPYLGATAFPAWLGEVLALAEPSRTWEVVNAGGISYASYRVLRLAEELAELEPDLYVVYAGHNEFLEQRNFAELLAEPPALRRLRGILHRSRIYTGVYRLLHALGLVRPTGGRTVLGDDVAASLEEVGGPALYHRDEVFRAGVIEQYRASLDAIARLARRQGIPLVLCTVASNLGGLTPFKSEHREGLTPQERERWSQLVGEAGGEYRAGRHREALALLDEAARIDDRHALLHFARGEVLRALGRGSDALAAFIRAKEEDIVPLRALEVFNDIVREAARGERIALADVDSEFRALFPEGITGPPRFLDHVHPDIAGHQLIALEVAEAAVRAGLVPVEERRWREAGERVADVLERRRGAVAPRYLAMGQWVAGRTLYWGGKRSEARPPLLEAWRTVRDIGEIPYYLGAIALGEGRPEEAAGLFREALAIEPATPRYLVGLARAHLEQGDARGAREALAAVRDPGREEPWYRLALGEATLLAGDAAGALPHLRAAVRLGVESEGALAALTRAELAAGGEEGAREAFGRLLALRGEPWSEAAWRSFSEGGSPEGRP